MLAREIGGRRRELSLVTGRKPTGGRAPALTAEDFCRASDVSRETLARLALYADLLRRWNRAINLVGRSSLEDLWRRHFLDSAQLLPLLPDPPAGAPRTLVDLGSGAGFPGLVLAILGAGDVHLIESNRRKAAFLREVARQTGTAVTVHEQRIEAVGPIAADVVTARACAPLDRLLGHASRFLGVGGAGGRVSGRCLFLKGKGVEEELTEALNRWTLSLERSPSVTDPAGTILNIEVRDFEPTRS